MRHQTAGLENTRTDWLWKADQGKHPINKTNLKRGFHRVILVLFVLIMLNCSVYILVILCEHIEQIARNCNQRFYLLHQLRKEGLNADCLKDLFQSIILSKILCAPSARGG